MNMNRRSFLRSGLVSGGAALLPGPLAVANPRATYRWRLLALNYDIFPVYGRLAHNFASRVSRLTDGQMQIDVEKFSDVSNPLPFQMAGDGRAEMAFGT